MQWFACATVKVIGERFPGVFGFARLHDFLSMSHSPSDMYGIADFLSRLGFSINFEKSILSSVSRLVYLEVDIDLVLACTHVPHSTSAIAECGEFWPLSFGQRLVGYLNFVSPRLKLPLELEHAVGEGDGDTCAASLPFIVD